MGVRVLTGQLGCALTPRWQGSVTLCAPPCEFEAFEVSGVVLHGVTLVTSLQIASVVVQMLTVGDTCKVCRLGTLLASTLGGVQVIAV